MATGQTIVEYNGARIFQCLTTRFEQREERTTDGADTLFYRFIVSVQGLAHANSIPTPNFAPRVEPLGVAGDAGSTMVVLRERMGEPRKQFRYIVGADNTGSGGNELLRAHGIGVAGGDRKERDVNNGPRNTDLQILHVVGNEIFKIQATFEICIPICDDYGGANTQRYEGNVLSNRWSVADSVDQHRMTTRVYSGLLRLVGGNINPNSFRRLVVPSLMPGMRLESMDFTCAADGLSLSYTITHREVAYSAPDPATSWEIVHTEKTALTDPIGVGEISIHLTGDRDADRRHLIALGLRIMNDRLRDGQSLRVNNHHILSLSVSDYFGSEGPQRVTINATVKHVVMKFDEEAGENKPDQILFAKEKIGSPIDAAVRKFQGSYNSHYSRGGREGEAPPIDGPVSAVGAFAAYLQSVCGGYHDIGCGGDTVIQDVGARRCTHPSVTARIGNPTPPDSPPSFVSTEHADAIYTSFRMESKYHTRHHRVAMPIASDYYNNANGDTQAIIALAPPTTTRVMRIRAARLGREPNLPTPVESYVDGENVAKLLDVKLLPTVPERTADGKRHFTVDAEYLYAFTRRLKTDSKTGPRVGVNPWEKSQVYRSTDALLGKYSEDTKT